MLCPHPMGLKRRATVPTLPPPHRVHPPAQRVRSSANFTPFAERPLIPVSRSKADRRKTTQRRRLSYQHVCRGSGRFPYSAGGGRRGGLWRPETCKERRLEIN